MQATDILLAVMTCICMFVGIVSYQKGYERGYRSALDVTAFKERRLAKAKKSEA